MKKLKIIINYMSLSKAPKNQKINLKKTKLIPKKPYNLVNNYSKKMNHNRIKIKDKNPQAL